MLANIGPKVESIAMKKKMTISHAKVKYISELITRNGVIMCGISQTFVNDYINTFI